MDFQTAFIEMNQITPCNMAKSKQAETFAKFI